MPQPGRRDEPHELEGFAWQQPARLGPPRPGTNPHRHVDVERQVDRARALPRQLERDLRHLVDTFTLDVADRDDGRSPLAANLDPGARRLPAADPDLHEVGRRRIRDVRRVKPRRRVHAFVEICLLGIDVAVEMDDADRAVDPRRQPADRGIADRVVAAEHIGNALDELRDYRVIWSKLFSILAGS